MKFHLNHPNNYSPCPHCGEWEYENSYCNACGYSVD